MALEPIAPMLTNMAVNIGFILAVWTHIHTIIFAWELQPVLHLVGTTKGCLFMGTAVHILRTCYSSRHDGRTGEGVQRVWYKVARNIFLLLLTCLSWPSRTIA